MRLIFGLGATFGDKFALGLREVRVFAGIAVKRVEQNEIENADEACRGETPSPSKMQKQDAEERYADGRREFGHRIEDCRCKAAFLLREPIPDGFGVCGEGGSFADTEKKAGCEEAADASGNRCGKGRDRPENRADAAYAANAEFVE